MVNAQRLHLAQMRALAFSTVRDFFARRGVLEVDTPLVSRAVSHDCHIDYFEVRTPSHPSPEEPSESPHSSPGARAGFLQTSPEPHLKRLLCAGFPDLYQICKAFRAGEAGKRHNPEFTLVEWYRRGYSLSQLEDETLALCQSLFLLNPASVAPAPVHVYTWEEAWLKFMGQSPFATEAAEWLKHPKLVELGVTAGDLPGLTDLWDFVMAHVIEPQFDPKALTVVRHFPLAQAAQSLPHPERPDLALRFEVYGGGFEIGNGYQELLDVTEYRRRFEAERAHRSAMGKPVPPLDEALLGALQNPGLPPCSGVAVGFDRLLMFALGHSHIGDVVLFPWGEH